ncbi:SUMO-interacting motif-containing protein 1 isoform X1 [Trachemys scripta elegans]|uniref:SUMO-interacting motif-containing protein 1 isoform X1 n=1 Tax=Trachemys scripta elegans TaxID=31138 RepID=UPI0015567E8E|nr:SUMO-interacting motif-containing protein 1 isoform X1 [Trachemys scripta elegans]
MAEGVIRLSDSGSEGGRSPPRRKRRRLPQRRAEIIDLTGEDVCSEAAVQDDFTVIDLTEVEEEHPADFMQCASPPSLPALVDIKRERKEVADQGLGAPWDGAHEETKGTHLEGYFSPVSSCTHSVCDPELSSSTTTINSDLGSLASLLLDSDVFSFSPTSSNSSSASLDCSAAESRSTCQQREDPEHLPTSPAQSQSPGLSSCPPASTPRAPAQPLLETSNSVLTAVKQEPPEPAKPRPVNKAWLHKLRYFRRTPVHHLFLQGVVQDEESRQNAQLRAQPIPSRKLSMVSTTMEENFPKGTLQFLMDFVSCHHYPPKEIVSHVIRNILLSSETGEMLKDAYMLLMKIQMLHPATTTMVGWDWELLRYVMEEQEETLPGRFLFLQYVVQTLEDDFQLNLRLRFLQKSIAKEVLSCDRCFSNVKEVIEWLVAAVTGLGFSQPRKQQQKAPCPSESSRADCSISSPGPDSAQTDSETGQAEAVLPAFLSQKVVVLLQRMLSIAVEVDRSPNCSANKIADVIFPYLVNIPLRSQREAFLNSMESQLLRCKVLELLFHHSCDMPASLPLSLSKILYFLGHHSPLLQYQDHEGTWQRWDEMLQHLILLLTSYRNVVLGHLRRSLSERMDLIISNAKPQLQDNDSITPVDIELHIKDFSSRLLQMLGKPLPSQLKDKVCMLQALLLTATST